MSLYGKLERMGNKFRMYNDMLVIAEGTYAARYVELEMNVLSTKFMMTLSEFYRDNELFREFIDSEDGNFLEKKYVEMFANEKSRKDKTEEEVKKIDDLFDMTGIFTKIGKRVVNLDAMKHQYKYTLKSYQDCHLNG